MESEVVTPGLWSKKLRMLRTLPVLLFIVRKEAVAHDV